MKRRREATTEGLRRDASENRTKILDAARHVFADHGTDAPLEAIATEAGVGIATLYRRFPTREDLLATIVGEELEAYLRVLQEALGRDDAWEGFSSFLEHV
jgi:AcrR family transcriptional regulator